MTKINQVISVGMCLVLLRPFSEASPILRTAHVKPSGETRVTAGSGRSAVEIKIYTHQVQTRDPKQKKFPSASPCTGSVSPCSIVDSIEVIMGGHPISVPLSAFCDLADLDTATLTIGQKSSKLKLTGGDASTSYIVKIDFDQKGVNQRTVAPGYAEDELLEKANYYSVVIGH